MFALTTNRERERAKKEDVLPVVSFRIDAIFSSLQRMQNQLVKLEQRKLGRMRGRMLTTSSQIAP